MKALSFLICALALTLPVGVAAQIAPPGQLAETELARTKRCVPAIARFLELEQELEPSFRRADRIQALHAAVALEESARVAPFDASDPIEAAVREWFVSDYELATQYMASRDEALQTRRDTARAQIRQRLQEALDPLRAEVETRLEAARDIQNAAAECEGVILVRSAAIEACQTVQSIVCEDARATEPKGRFAFVESAPDLWDVEELRPWSEPVPLFRTPEGALAGARTATRTRRGNFFLTVGIEPMIQQRSTLSPEQLAEMKTNLDSLGLTFEDPRYAMTPVITIQLNVDQPLGGETHHILHFGDMSDPVNDVVWTAPVTAGQPVQVVVPAAGWILKALAANEPISFTAVKLAEEGRAEVVYQMAVAPVGQGRAVSMLLSYIGTQLAKDLATLAPPTPATSTP